MATNEIEKLERRYAENPNGLTFAPLAEVYRKTGDVTRALEMLGPGVERHPAYIPAHIVLGRCHLDLGDLPEAERTFTHVLTLDGENVIALKALADISERLLRYDDAERWLHTLLSVDRSNEAAQEQLARLEVARRQVELGSSAVPDSARVTEPAEEPAPQSAAADGAAADATAVESAVESKALSPDVTRALPSTVAEPAAPSAKEPETVPWTSEADADADMAIEPSPLALEDVALRDDHISPAEGLEPQDHDQALLTGPVESLAGLVRPDSATLRDELGGVEDDGGEDDFRIETADELILRPSAASEFQMPDASQELIATAPDPGPDPLSVPRPAIEKSSSEPEPASVPAAESPFEAEPQREAEQPVELESAVEATQAELAPAEPTLIVTETMAEVLLQQGYTADALQIYRELERRSGGDQRLRDKLTELETQTSTGPKPVGTYAARDTGGQSVGAFFNSLLAARLSAAAAPPTPAPTGAGIAPATPGSAGAPTRPAADSLSLSAVFGDETSPVLPAVPAAPKPDVSFDEFFGSPDAGRAAKVSRTPEPKEDDLDQFHTWLQNLKR